MTDLRATAERPDSPVNLSFAAVNEFVHEPDQCFEHLQWLCLTLATALDARADDGQAVTPGWLEAIGFRDGDECQAISAANGTTLEFSGIGWFYGFDSEPLPDQPTRGHVRALAKALGIPLMEVS
jgi:hypothetical protein